LPSRAEPDQIGIVADLWRFPVKSFGGERIRRAFVGPFGLLGDRRFAVVDDASGEALTARRVSRLLGFRARYSDGEPAEDATVTTPGGMVLAPDDPELAAAVGEAAGRPVTLVRHAAGLHDAAPLHLLSQSSLAALGEMLGTELDVRRFRPNVVVELDDPHPFGEAAWPGVRLRIAGALTIDVVVPTERCAVTTFDPDTQERDTGVLAAISRERDNFFGVYARVAAPGWIAVGDTIRVTGPAPAAARA
jgi:MOSC domain-containing protein